LEPGCLIVIRQVEEVSLRKSRSTEKLHFVSEMCLESYLGGLTANDPGAFLAAVQPQPLYNPNPSSLTIRTTPRPRKASGFVCRLILSTSRGRRTISPMPIKLEGYVSYRKPEFRLDITDLPANECIIAFPVLGPKVSSKNLPWCLAR
jgi:hypothetical protein